MTEWFIVADCKSVRIFPVVGSNPTSFKQCISKYNAVGSVPVLGTGSHVFKSHYFEVVCFNLKKGTLSNLFSV